MFIYHIVFKYSIFNRLILNAHKVKMHMLAKTNNYPFHILKFLVCLHATLELLQDKILKIISIVHLAA